MPTVTTDGLVDFSSPSSTIPSVGWAVATGTADAILAAYTPANTSLPDGLILAFRAAAANVTATPTFAPDGLAPHPITKKGGSPLEPSDIPAANFEALVRYNKTNARWELLNRYLSVAPSTSWGVAGGAADALAITRSPVRLSIPDGELVSFRALLANATTTPTLAVDNLTAYTITARGGAPLQIGDISGPGAEYMARFNLANTRWELINPSRLLSATQPVGYATGAGGAVTQLTSKVTPVTLNKPSGQITLNNGNITTGQILSFTLTDSFIGPNDVLVLNHLSGGSVGAYTFNAQCGAGSAVISIRNGTAGTLGETIVLSFALIKGAVS